MMKPGLSIIIPTLDEAETLPSLFADLAVQKNVNFEIIVSDGGSSDATIETAERLLSVNNLSGTCLLGPVGRGRQLNAGVAIARADWFLFLHADSRLPDQDQLQKALAFMPCCLNKTGTVIAGRFALRFDHEPGAKSFALFYYETKARLGRPGCVHGDQGMLISNTCFAQVGPFREDLAVMEDTTLAEQIRTQGEWLLLPGEIITSARRFEVEGWRARQTLNALMMNFLAIGWLDFFVKAPEVYRQQDKTKPLLLSPFYRLIMELLSKMSVRERWSLWLATGAYVRGQAWQIALAMDCRKAYQRNLDYPQEPGFWLRWFDRWFDPLTNHRVGCFITALLVRLWFAIQQRRPI
jgi:rSAM/selenodomain-associated transferase 2